MNLVVVESPTKARTLARYLGDGYAVEATYGHVRDLPERKMGVKITKKKDGEYVFDPEYVVGKKQKERIEQIKKMVSSASNVYLATDPDREGEAIAWHVGELVKNGKKDKLKRIVFHEITKGAIMDALAHPKEVDDQLVDAQQARRILDRLVGYRLSPLLWKKVRRGLSAGRVQSVAVRLIVEREREIEAFTPVEYWDIVVVVGKTTGEEFRVELTQVNDAELTIGNSQRALEVEADLQRAKYSVERIDKKEFLRTPPAPYTTSTMQQGAANKLGWTAKRTMQVAQSLYEEGLITYHRTDSTNIAMEAATAVRDYVGKKMGLEYALSSPRWFKTKSKVAQEAHEAIRPTDVFLIDGIKERVVNRDQERLYELVWKRFVACQMAEARGETVKIKVAGEVGAKRYGLEAKGETVTFEGWYAVERDGKKTKEVSLPEVLEGELLNMKEVTKLQKFTQPPARFNDASLIKTLEEMGIGRPSTYAPTISTIQDRLYVEREEKKFKPTALGVAVNDFLVTNFPVQIDYGFTAGMEDQLDSIANGEKKWMPVLGEFFGPFEEQIEKVEDTAQRVKVEVELTGEKCPKCTQGDVIIRLGKFGKFLACSRFPECDYKANFQNKVGIKCPKCSDGEVIMRKTRKGKNFYGCSGYPKCDFASWNKPNPTEAVAQLPEVSGNI